MTQDNIQHGIDNNPNNDAQKGAALGGVGGAAVGVAAGAPAGPVGAVVGAVVGGVAGAVGSGAAVSAVDKMDNDNTVSGLGDGASSGTSTTGRAITSSELSPAVATSPSSYLATDVSDDTLGQSQRICKGKDIIGLKVISRADGADLGSVKDLVYDHDLNEVVAVLVGNKDLFGLIEAQAVPWTQIRSIGEDAVVAEDANSRIKVSYEPRIKRLMERNTSLSGTKVYTTEGQHLGTFADLYIDEATGEIVGYEVSGGFISDSMTGKTFVPADEVELGRDVALVPPEVAEEIERQKQEEPGGLKATTSSMGEQISTTAGSVGDKVSGAVAGAASSTQESALEATIDKTAGREVRGADNELIVAPGQTITQGAVDLARLEGKEQELIAAAGTGVAGQSLDSAKAGAANMWDSLKEKAAELTGAAHEKKAEYDAQAEQSRINDALGRPTTRVILDQADNVILNTGDLITHAAIDRARTAGVLEVLLDSVYTADPDITPEMMRAKEPGQAALPTQAQPTGGPITATVRPDQPAQDTPEQGLTTT